MTVIIVSQSVKEVSFLRIILYNIGSALFVFAVTLFAVALLVIVLAVAVAVVIIHPRCSCSSDPARRLRRGWHCHHDGI
jgi:Flp pilus assembly protein TadB